jgi:hypothetical protein
MNKVARLTEVTQSGEHWNWKPGPDGKVWLLVFWCPGCNEPHGVPVRGSTTNDKQGWEFSGDEVRPTLTPSVDVNGKAHCHSHVSAGQIQFLGDCTHALRGQTVPLPPLS